jgi:solute carrier family 12 sodium/potassium/chloride transporter 2
LYNNFLQDPSSAIPIGTLLAILITFISYVCYAFMMGGCVLRTASGNVTEYLQVKGEPNEWAVFSNCTDRPCLYGLHNDNQVCMM